MGTSVFEIALPTMPPPRDVSVSSKNSSKPEGVDLRNAKAGEEGHAGGLKNGLGVGRWIAAPSRDHEGTV